MLEYSFYNIQMGLIELKVYKDGVYSYSKILEPSRLKEFLSCLGIPEENLKEVEPFEELSEVKQ